MKRTNTILLASFAWLAQAACSSDDPAAAPSRPPVPPPASSASSGGAADGGGGGGTGKDCFDTDAGAPTQAKDFLNQCTSAECFPFDNGSRIEGFTPGAALPPLN